MISRLENMAVHSMWVLLVIFATTCFGDQSPQEYDTIVVGMGAAGTTAASDLAKAGLRVLGLDAQSWIGGRVHTVPFGDGLVELGAEWIHGTEGSTVYKAAIDNNITLLATENFQLVQSDGTVASAALNELMDAAFKFFHDGPDSNATVSVGEHITSRLMDYIRKKMPDILEDKGFIDALLTCIDLQVDSWEASNSWNDLNANNPQVVLEGKDMTWNKYGYKTFFDILLNKYNGGSGLPSLEVKLNTEVTKIERPSDPTGKVVVTCKDGTVYKADNVIVTVSVGVLKERHTSLFSPPLPPKKATAIEKIQIGVIGKIIMSFPQGWWHDNNPYFGFFWRAEDLKKVPAEDYWITRLIGASASTGSSNVIEIWTNGEVTKQVEKMPEERVKSKSMEILRQFITNTTIPIPEPTGFLRSTWFSNEFTRGTYTYDDMLMADTPTARADLAAPLRDEAGVPRVLFAGEATHPTYYSYVHGAADSGRRAATEILTLRENQKS